MKRLIAAVLLLLTAVAGAQDVPPPINQGEQLTLTWVQDPVCTDGTPISGCPVTGYHVQIEREQQPNVWVNVSTAPMGAAVRSYVWTANGAGTTCFRVNVLNSAAYEATGPSNIKCVRVLVPLKPGASAPILSSSKD